MILNNVKYSNFDNLFDYLQVYIKHLSIILSRI